MVGAIAAVMVFFTTPLLTGPPLRRLAQADSSLVREVACAVGEAFGPNAKLWVAPILVIERIVPGFQEKNYHSGGILAPLVMYAAWAVAGMSGGVLTWLGVHFRSRKALREDLGPT